MLYPQKTVSVALLCFIQSKGKDCKEADLECDMLVFLATIKWCPERCPTVHSYRAQKPDDPTIVPMHQPNYSM
jgi:hypothetical protein